MLEIIVSIRDFLVFVGNKILHPTNDYFFLLIIWYLACIPSAIKNWKKWEKRYKRKGARRF